MPFRHHLLVAGGRETGCVVMGDVEGVVAGALTTTEGVGVSVLVAGTNGSIFSLLSSSTAEVAELELVCCCTGLSSFVWLLRFLVDFPDSPKTLPLGVTTLSTKFDVVNLLPLTVASGVLRDASLPRVVVVGEGTGAEVAVTNGSSTGITGEGSTTGGVTKAGLVVPLTLPLLVVLEPRVCWLFNK